MSKVVKLSSVMEREEKLKEIYEGLEEIKDQLTALIDEYEEEESHTGKAESVHHALVVLRLSQIKCKYQIQSIVKA